MYSLESFGLSDMTELGAHLRELGADAGSMEEVAQRLVRSLYEQFGDDESGEKDCALVRFYVTVDYEKLESELQQFGRELMQDQELGPSTRCLTLLATAGDRSEWNSRAASRGHKTIPLPSEEVVQTIPMVSQLLVQLGLDVGHVVSADPELLLEEEQHTYNVFHVSNALGSPFIPAQEEFVIPRGIKSVLGFGGLLPSGNVFAVLLFTRRTVPRETADIFRNAAMNIKLGLLPFDGERPFAAGGGL